MIRTERAALIRYDISGQAYIGSGLRVGSEYILTADHCANGKNHRVTLNGLEFNAEVYVRSHSESVDLAILVVPGIGEMDQLDYALVDRSVASLLDDCQALGFPRWKKQEEYRVLAQIDGRVPTAEGLRADVGNAGHVGFLSFKISGPQIPSTPLGNIDSVGSPWGGMSGAGVVAGNSVIGVVRSHNLAEGGGSLTFTSIGAVSRLPQTTRDKMLRALGIADVNRLSLLPFGSEISKKPDASASGKESEGGSRARVLKEVTQDWVRNGTSVGVLQGFSGIGKSTTALRIDELHANRTLIDVEIPPGLHSAADLLVLIGTKFAQLGRIGVSLGSDPVYEISAALKEGGILLLDDFHNCLLAESGAPEHGVQNLVNSISRRIRNSSGRILIVADEAAKFPWLDDETVFTLTGMTGGEGAQFLSQTLRALNVPSGLSVERMTEVVNWLGGNPRAIQVLASCLRYDTLDDLVSLEPEVWEMRDRLVDASFTSSLESVFLR